MVNTTRDFSDETESDRVDRLEEALSMCPALCIEGIDIHGATFGDGTEEHATCIITFRICGGMVANFVLETAAAEAMIEGLTEVVPSLKQKAAELKARRN